MKGNSFTSNKKTSIKTKSIILSVISIIELILILTTMTYSWFEGLTSLEIIGENLNTASRLNSEFIIGEGPDYENTTAELNTFFDAQTNGKLSPVSSFDGENFYALYSGNATDYTGYLQGVENGTLKFRKLNDEDVNSSIISFQFEVTAATGDTDFWLKKMPEFTVGGTTLSNENNPFRIRISDGSSTTPSSEGNLILTSKEEWPTGKFSTSADRANMLALEGVTSTDAGDLKEANDALSNRAIYKVFDGRKCDDEGWLINDNGEFIDADGNVTEEGTVKNLNQNGKQVLFSVKKGETKIITITIWLEALDQSFTSTNVAPGDEVKINLEFCSSWDVMDTITFRDRTAEQWIDAEDDTGAAMQFGVVNLGSDSNYWYGKDHFTYDATNKNWTGQIPRAVQNIKFVWQKENSSVVTEEWEAGIRDANATYTVFGTSAAMWYSGPTIKISMHDYTSSHWLANIVDGVATKMRVQVTYNGTPLAYSMTDSPVKDNANKNTWYAFIPDVDTVVFNRCKTSSPDVAENTWNGINRGVETQYYALDGGSVETVEGTPIYLTVSKADAEIFFYQQYLPAVSMTSTYNQNYILNTIKGDKTKIHQSAYRVTGSQGTEQDKWFGDQGKMTLFKEDDYSVTYVFYFDEIPDGTYLTFWNRPQVNYNNLDNETRFAPCFQYNASAGNEFYIWNAVALDDPNVNGGFTSAYVFTEVDMLSNDGSGGNTTKPGTEQNGQWGAPNLPDGTYQTWFVHTANTATSVTAKFEYYGNEYTVNMVQNNADKRFWYTDSTAIPDDVTSVTFTDNSGNTWSTASSGTRTSSTNYYYATSNTTGKWSAKITVPNGTYRTYFAPQSTSITSVTVSYVYNGVPFSVSMTKGSDGYWYTDAIPDSASSIVFTDSANHTWNATGTRSASANYYITTSNTAGAWGKPVSDKNIVYLSPGVWNVDGAWYAAYFWNDSGNKWIKMTDSDGDGIYECEVPDGYTNIIFCRMNKDKTALDWNSKWNQTNDLTISGSNNHYTISGWGGEKSPGSWSSK